MKCTLLIPTYRDSVQTRANLSYLAQFAGDELAVYIADNSESKEKHHFLNTLKQQSSHIKIFCHPHNIGGFNNGLFLLEESSQSPYIVFCFDDDYITLDFITKSVDCLEHDSSLARSSGKLIAIQQSQGGVIKEEANQLEDDVVHRMAQCFNPSSFNLSLYSVIRRSLLNPWIAFIKNHPLDAAFFDFLLTSSLLAQGKMLQHNEGFYLWSSDNWAIPEENFNNRAKFYEAQNLPRSFTMLFDLHFSVECVSFFMGKHSPLSDQQQQKDIAHILWERCIERFRQAVQQDEQAYISLLSHAPEALNALKDLYHCVNPETNPKQTLEQFSMVLSAFSNELANNYRTYIINLFEERTG